MNRIRSIARGNMTLKTKLLLGFTGMLVLFLGVALYNLEQVRDIKTQLSKQNDKVELKLMALELKEMVQELNIIASGLEISKKVEYIPKYNEKRKLYDEMIKRIGDTATTPEQAKWRSKLISLTVDYTNTFDVAAKLIQENKLSSADLDTNMEYLYNESQKLMGEIFVYVDQFYVTYAQDAELAVSTTQKLLDSTVMIMLIASVFVVFFGAAIAFLLIRSFMAPIKKLQQAVKSMAEGDLRYKINSRSKDELGELSHSFDHMIDQVRSMLANTQGIAAYLSDHSGKFHSLSGSTAAANAEIVRAIQEISHGAELQASQSEQSTSIIAELKQEIDIITAFTQTVAKQSRETVAATHAGSGSMEALRQASGKSEAVLDQVYRAMENLSSSSDQINKIVNTIRDISHQTHVLSINAAIEAARAGVHGRGFSVIAEEVRLLAAQSNDSSKLITKIIQSLLEQTKDLEAYLTEAKTSFDTQNGKMNESLNAFGQIRGSMEELSQRMGPIEEQIALIQAKNGQLVESVQYVAAIAQETAAGVEEVSAASSEQDSAIQQIASQADDIRELSRNLFGEINKFRIGELDVIGEDANGKAEAEFIASGILETADSGLSSEGVGSEPSSKSTGEASPAGSAAMPADSRVTVSEVNTPSPSQAVKPEEPAAQAEADSAKSSEAEGKPAESDKKELVSVG